VSDRPTTADANDVHRVADSGFSRAAERYVRGRPDYPAQLDGWLRERLGLGEGQIVLDLGAGTGKFTSHLIATGAQVIAVEPVAAMLAQLRTALPDVDARIGTAQAIPLADASVDVVVCAQSFHWFATVAALADIRRVLKPGGTLGLVWNTRDERVDWVAALTQIMRPLEGDVPRLHTGDWRRVFPAPGFGPLHEQHFPHAHVGSPERVIIDRVLSVSFIASLDSEQRERVTEQLRNLIDAHPELRGRTEVSFPYDTIALSCPRLS